MEIFKMFLNSSNGRNDCDPEFSINITLADVSGYTYNDGQIFVIAILLPILLLFGFLSNSAFMFVVYRCSEMRTVTNWYLTNLAIADILFLFSAIVDKIWAYSVSPIPGDNGPHGHVGCVILYLIADLTYFSSLCFITLVSFDRFLAVRRPQVSKVRRCKVDIPTRLCAGSWVLGLCFAAFLIPSRGTFIRYCLEWPQVDAYQDWPLDMYVCRSKSVWMDAFSNVIQTVPFFLTFALNVYLYTNIIRGLDRSIQNLGKHGLSQNQNLAMRHQIARMLVVNGVVFFVCLFPFELLVLFNVIRNVQGTDIIPVDWQDLLFEISRALSYINSAANPLIYTVMSRRYRANFRAAFVVRRCSSSHRNRRGSNAYAANSGFGHTSLKSLNATRTETL